MDWNDDVIGMDKVKEVNLEIGVSGASAFDMPATIDVQLGSFVPNSGAGTTTMAKPAIPSIPRYGTDPSNPERTLYRLSRPITS
jgi:hypothetical protein